MDSDGELPLSEDRVPLIPSWSGEVFTIKLRDLSGLSDNQNQILTFICPSSLSFGEFLKDVSARTSLALDSFDVLYQTKKEDVRLTHFYVPYRWWYE